MVIAETIRLILVRAGRTGWEEAGRVHGVSAVSLSEEGVRQMGSRAEEVRGRGMAEGVKVVLGGEDTASAEATGLLAEELGVKARLSSGFSEVDMGLWEGMLWSELNERYERAAREWESNLANVLVPGGEAVGDARERLISSVAEAAGRVRAGGTLCVVLRPIAMGLVRGWVEGAEGCELCSMVADEEGVRSYVVNRDVLGAPAATAR